METLVAVLLQVASAASSAPPPATASVVWASHPVRSNETLMLQGYGVNAATRVTLQGWNEGTKGWGRKLELEPESHSASGVSVVLPVTASPFSAYRVSAGGASFVTVNAPEVWWALGDAGDSATNGGKGWVRLFGRSIHLGSGGSTLQLTDSTGKATTIPMEAGFSHTGAYCARFRIPAGLSPGTYDIATANSLAPSYFAPMRPWFESQDRPQAKGQLRIVAPPRSQWPQKVFVIEFQQLVDRPAPTDATPALNRALVQARQAGGGVVYLPPGAYTVTGQIDLPASTILKGAGADKTWLTLAKQNMTEAPQTGYFTSNMTGGWGVEDLTVYTSSAGYYYS